MFRNFKKNITEVPILALPHIGEEFLLETDASYKGLGAVLSQQIEGSDEVDEEEKIYVMKMI